MTPKDKAIQLRDKFIDSTKVFFNNEWHTDLPEAKKCALIVVDEILSNIPMYTGNLNVKWKFYNSVKDELEKL